jgi:phosphopantothenate-cysteine ligase
VLGTVAEYASRLRSVLETHPIDIAFLAMAVSDYEPLPSAGKIDSHAETLSITCQRTPKVIRQVRGWNEGLYLVGFKLMAGADEAALLATARAACVQNQADLTVANDQRAIDAGKHRLHLVRPAEDPVTLEPGDDQADQLVDQVFAWFQERTSALPAIPLDDDDDDDLDEPDDNHQPRSPRDQRELP